MYIQIIIQGIHGISQNENRKLQIKPNGLVEAQFPEHCYQFLPIHTQEETTIRKTKNM